MAEDVPLPFAQLARAGRARRFAADRFEALLGEVAPDQKDDTLCRLLAEWTGITLSTAEAAPLWARVLETHGRMKASLGETTSLQTALLHEVHTRLGLLRDPHVMSEEQNRALEVNAVTDPLTGLYNRRYLRDHLAREVARAQRTQGIVSALVVDLQGFKRVNDRLGHHAGDAVLVKVAGLIRQSLRTLDTACRFGGDEFVAILPSASLVDSLTVAQRIRLRVEGIKLPRPVNRVGMHYGIASHPTDAATPDELIEVADRRLYACREHNTKNRGRRHPRFPVQGLEFQLGNGDGSGRRAEIRDIGYGGFAFIFEGGGSAPDQVEGDIVQENAQCHHVAARTVSVVPVEGGASRVGCEYVH